ncbi:hypothetical protein BKI52_04630 [marine bacterium AO1-C]|nr:hypothetical protein BKI52_04630 [marine bacterium AO1-C]
MTQEKQTAFTQAYAHCRQRFERYCLALAYGKMDAQDLIQDVLLSTYERFDQVKHKDQLLHYLIRAARNRSISQWRKAQFQTELQEKHTRQLFAQGVTPEITLDIQLLYQKMEVLPNKQRDAIILFDICGFSLKEVADIQHTSTNTVKSHLRRGRKKLQQLLEDKPKSRWLAGILLPVPEVSKIGFGSFKQFIFQLKPITMYSLSSVVLAGVLAVVLPQKLTQDQAHPVVQASIAPSVYESITPPIAPQVVNKPTLAKVATVKKPQAKVVTLKPIRQANVADTPTTPLFKSNPPKLVAKPKASIFNNPKQPSVFANNNTPSFLSPSKPTLDKDLEGCERRIPRIDHIKLFKTRLLKKLKKDGLISSAKARNKLSFQGKKVLINGKMIPNNLQTKYLEFLDGYGVTPCPDRFVATSSAYIAVGKVISGGRFKGQIQGKMDLAELGYD